MGRALDWGQEDLRSDLGLSLTSYSTLGEWISLSELAPGLLLGGVVRPMWDVGSGSTLSMGRHRHRH